MRKVQKYEGTGRRESHAWALLCLDKNFQFGAEGARIRKGDWIWDTKLSEVRRIDHFYDTVSLEEEGDLPLCHPEQWVMIGHMVSGQDDLSRSMLGPMDWPLRRLSAFQSILKSRCLTIDTNRPDSLRDEGSPQTLSQSPAVGNPRILDAPR